MSDKHNRPRLPNSTVMPFVVLGFLFVGFIAFGHTIAQPFLMMDDPYLVVANRTAHGPSFSNIARAFSSFDPELYIPVTLMSYQMNFLMTGLSASSYHATNVLLHSFNALLVAWLLLLLLRKRWLAVFGALVFMLHPLQAEAVSWVAGRKDVLCTFFFLLSFITYIYFSDEQESSRKKRLLLVGSIALFVLALLSKVLVATLPAIFVLYDVLWKKKSLKIGVLKDKIPFLALSVIFLGVATLGKVRVLASESLWNTALMAAKSTVFYLTKFFWPVDLSVFYPQTTPISISSSEFFIPVIILVALAALTFWAWKKSKRLVFVALFFIVTLAPTFWNFHKGEVIFFAVDRYVYIPSIGIILALLIAVGFAFESITLPGKNWIARGIGTALLIGLLVMTRAQVSIWDSSEGVFEHALKLYPQSVSARTSLAEVYDQNGDFQKELSLLKAGLAYNPHESSVLLGIGSIYARQNKLADARMEYEKAKAANPTLPEPLFFLASLAEQEGKPAEAMDLYKQAIALDPSYVSARVNLAGMLIDAGDFTNAEAQISEGLKWNPSSFELLANSARLMERNGKTDEALARWYEALDVYPDSPDVLAAIAAHEIEKQNYDGAIKLIKEALAIDPENQDAVGLKRILLSRRKWVE